MPTQRKLLIQMSGAPGSGKSTLARLLRPSLGAAAAVVDHDVLRSAFLSAGLAFEPAARHAYALQWTLAEDLLRQGLSVVVDSTCNFRETAARGAALAAAHGCAYWHVECRVRDAAVDEPPAGAGEGGRERFARWMEGACRPETGNVVVVDGTEEPEKLRDDVVKRIAGQLIGVSGEVDQN